MANNETYTAPDGTTKTNTIRSAIKQNADNIDLRVEKANVIASINASIENDGTSAVKISADKVNIEGAAIFNSGRLSTTSLNNAYDAKGSASAAQTAAINAAAADATQKANDAQSAAEATASKDATQKANAAQSAAISAAATDATEKANAAQSAAEATAAADATEKANAARDAAISAAATDATTKANAAEANAKANAVKRTQRIWYRSNSTTAPATPGTKSSNWVTKADDGNDAWTKMHIAISSTHKYIYTCEQYEMANGTVGYTSVLLDNTITVIDGGNIITGSVKANAINASSGTFDTANIPELTANHIKANVISSINQSTETVKIQASKVEIDGTAVFSAISSDVDDAITDKGYATTTQAQGYANTAKSEAISAAATDATSKANAAEANAKAAIPSDISELNNDTGFITNADVPTKVSELTNDSGFQTASQVNTTITGKGYQTASQVDSAITSKGYQTSSQVNSAITSKGYATTTQAQGYASTAKSEAISAAASDATSKANAAQTAATNAANTATDNKLKSYSTTQQMNEAIQDATGPLFYGRENSSGYIHLGHVPYAVSSNSNYSHLHLTGRIGGWLSTTSGSIDVTFKSRADNSMYNTVDRRDETIDTSFVDILVYTGMDNFTHY